MKLLKNESLRLFFIWLFMGALVFLVGIINVKAATIDRLVYMNRTGPGFTTNFNASGVTKYTTQYIVTATNDTPNYMYAKTCSTGPLEIAVSSVSGSLSYDGYVKFGSCKVNGYNGSNYVYIYSLNNFDDAGQGQRGITYSMTVSNKLSYTAFINVYDISFSDSLDYDKALIETNQTIIDQNQTIIDQNQQTNDKLDDLNDNLTSEDMPNAPDFSDVEVADDTPISDLVLMPINYLNKLINAFSGQCSPYVLDFGILGSDYVLNLPCIKVENWIGQSAWNIVDALICFFMAYEIGMLAVKIFNDWTSMRDTYDSLYQPKHEDKGYKPKHGGSE